MKTLIGFILTIYAFVFLTWIEPGKFGPFASAMGITIATIWAIGVVLIWRKEE